MKIKIILKIILLGIFLIGCTSEIKKSKKVINQHEYPNKCNSNKKPKVPFYSGKQKFTAIETLYANINLYQNNLDYTYLVKNNSAKKTSANKITLITVCYTVGW